MLGAVVQEVCAFLQSAGVTVERCVYSVGCGSSSDPLALSLDEGLLLIHFVTQELGVPAEVREVFRYALHCFDVAGLEIRDAVLGGEHLQFPVPV